MKQLNKNLFGQGCAVILLFLAMIIPYSGKGAITLDATSTAAANAAAISMNHVTGTGANGILIVTVVINSGSITSVQYDVTTMTLFGSRTRNNMTTAMYYLVAPTAGSWNVLVNVSGGSTNIRAGAVTYFGVNPTVPLQDLMTADNGTSNPSATFYSDPGLAVVLLGARANPTPVSQAQVYERGNTQFNNLSTTATLGTATLNYTMASDDWVMVAGLLNPMVVLPVTFGPIKVSKQTEQIALNWNMYDLKSIQTISVERSTDGKNFVHLGDLELPATSTTVQFKYFDKDAPKQLLYYRIALKGTNGMSEYSPVTAINNAEETGTFNVYPIPSADKVNIQSGTAIRKVTLLNLSGQTLAVFQNSEYTVSQFDISRLNVGFYFLHIEDEEGNISKQKIQKI